MEQDFNRLRKIDKIDFRIADSFKSRLNIKVYSKKG